MTILTISRAVCHKLSFFKAASETSLGGTLDEDTAEFTADCESIALELSSFSLWDFIFEFSCYEDN